MGEGSQVKTAGRCPSRAPYLQVHQGTVCAPVPGHRARDENGGCYQPRGQVPTGVGSWMRVEGRSLGGGAQGMNQRWSVARARGSARGNATPGPPAARPVACPAARTSGDCHGTEGIVPFVNGPFEWAVAITTFLSILSIVPRHYARLTHFFHRS